MADKEVSFTSLCCIKRDLDGLWLYRLADIENNMLHLPYKSLYRTDSYFENRDRLFYNSDDGFLPECTLGIWDWKATPNRNNPDKDYVQSAINKNYTPVRVVIVQANSIEDLFSMLKQGKLRTKEYRCNTMFCFASGDKLTGVVCKTDEFFFEGGVVRINESVYVLPLYSYSRKSVFYCKEYDDDPELCFLKELLLNHPLEYIAVKDVAEVIKTLILERATKAFFDENIGGTRSERQTCIRLLKSIGSDSIYEELSRLLCCSEEKAKLEVDKFISRASDLLETDDIDIDVLGRIAVQHDGLRQICEDTLLDEWRESHKEMIAEAEKELASVNAAIEMSKKDYDIILMQKSSLESELSRLNSEIKRREALGDETLCAVRSKIADAQRDMASFIAEVSVFLPERSNTGAANNNEWYYKNADVNSYQKSDFEYLASREDEFDLLFQNLAYTFGIEKELCSMFAAFIYAVIIYEHPILIAGPYGREIADTVSVSIFGIDSGKIQLANGANSCIVDSVANEPEQIVSVSNMFGRDWNDTLPQDFEQINNKRVIWTHPYVEDLSIEPKGLFNYMIPVFSECFVSTYDKRRIIPGIRKKDFDAFSMNEEKPFLISSISKLGLSKKQQNGMKKTLSCAKKILGDPNKEKDLEVLFCVLPFSVLFGRKDILKEIIDLENGISNSVKAEVSRFIDDKEGL